MIKTKHVVYAAMVGGLYIAMVWAFGPISFGVVQFRVANLLKPLVLLSPAFAFGFGAADVIANLGSPFGAFDFIGMPVVEIVAGLVAWRLRKIPVLALSVQAAIISLGVSAIPLRLGGGIPIALSIGPILIAQLLAIIGGWLVLWRPLWAVMASRMRNDSQETH